MLHGSVFLASSPAYPTSFLASLSLSLSLVSTEKQDQRSCTSCKKVMGREWQWGGTGRSSHSKSGGVGGEKDTSFSGCISAVFHFFDFHQFHFQQPSFNSTSILPQEPTIPKGSLSLSQVFLSLSLYIYIYISLIYGFLCNIQGLKHREIAWNHRRFHCHILQEKKKKKKI